MLCSPPELDPRDRRRVEDRIAPEVFEPGNFVLGQRQLHY